MSSQTDRTALRALLSEERFSTYLRVCKEADAAFALYEWNVQIGAALFELTSYLEVPFRNAIAEQLQRLNRNQSRYGEWYDQRHWFTDVHNQTIDQARITIASRGKALGHGQMVAHLPFGFWRYLLDRNYHDFLWIRALRFAFPHSSGSRSEVYSAVEKVHRLRNRIAHHEPVFSRDHRADEANILEIAGWIDPGLSAWIRSKSRVTNVLGERPALASS